MTRTQQTAWVVSTLVLAVIAIITAYTVIENKKEMDRKYPGCWQLIGENTECKANIAVDRLMGRPIGLTGSEFDAGPPLIVENNMDAIDINNF